MYTPSNLQFLKLGSPIHRESWWSVIKGLFVKRDFCMYNGFLYVRKNVFEVIYENFNFLYFRKKANFRVYINL